MSICEITLFASVVEIPEMRQLTAMIMLRLTWGKTKRFFGRRVFPCQASLSDNLSTLGDVVLIKQLARPFYILNERKKDIPYHGRLGV